MRINSRPINEISEINVIIKHELNQNQNKIIGSNNIMKTKIFI